MRHVLRFFFFHKHVQLFQHHLLKRRSFHLSVPFVPLSKSGNSLVVQWLELRAFTAMGLGLIPGWGTKIMQAVWHSTARKKKYQLTIFLDFVFCLLSVYSCINTTLF